MILVTHALTGAVIGKNINNPWLIIIASLIIHYAMDSIRHGEYFDERTATVKDTWWKVTIDLFIGFFIIFMIIFFQKISSSIIINVSLGVFFSIIPDFVTLMHWTFKGNGILAKIKAFHGWAHRYSKFPKHSWERQWTLKNAFNDIIISAIAIAILLIF
jgi:hypothetical protein